LDCGRPLRKGERRAPNCRWRAAANWKVPLNWIARGMGALVVIIILLFPKIKFRPPV
jgi:hypothetical protein